MFVSGQPRNICQNSWYLNQSNSASLSQEVSFPVANIYPPDDEFLKALLVKQFLEKDIIVTPDIIEYIIKHIPRHASSVKYLVEQADLLSFEQKHKITIPFIKKIMEKFED